MPGSRIKIVKLLPRLIMPGSRIKYVNLLPRLIMPGSRIKLVKLLPRLIVPGSRIKFVKLLPRLIISPVGGGFQPFSLSLPFIYINLSLVDFREIDFRVFYKEIRTQESSLIKRYNRGILYN